MAEIEINSDSGVPLDDTLSAVQSDSMQEYYRLQQQLLLTTLGIAGVVFGSVWYFYSLPIAVNYLLGACTGAIYLRMLGKNVEKLGRERKRLGSTQLVPFIGLIIVATQWHQLQIIPIFLGFLTYKAAVIVYILQTTFRPDAR